MPLAKTALVAAAVSLMIGSSAVAATPAAPSSALAATGSPVRAGTHVGKSEKANAGTTILLLALLAGAIAGLAATGGGHGTPASP